MSSTSFKDRTDEFNTIVQNLKVKDGGDIRKEAASTTDGGDIRKEAASTTVIKKKASIIITGVHNTRLNLKRLREMANQTYYLDYPKDIKQLTAVIKQDMTALDKAMDDLQSVLNSQNGSSSSDTSTHSDVVVEDCRNRVTRVRKELIQVGTMLEKKLQDRASISKQFFTRQPFTQQQPLAHNSSNVSSAPPAWVKNSSSSPLCSRKPADGESQPLIQQQQQMVLVQDSFTQSRAEDLRRIESDIHEVGGLLTQLATVVSQQGETWIRIDESMESTLAHVEGAQGQLMRHLNDVSSNRWLMLKIFFILIVFLVIFLFFVA